MRVTLTSTPAVSRPLEWWERWAQRRAQWWAERPGLARSAAQVRTVLLWAGLVWLAVVLVALPELRPSARAYLGSLWIVVAWYLMGRTKTLTWSGYLRFFTACLPLSVVIGLISTVLSGVGGLGVSSAGAGTAIAALTEEALKLVPLAAIAVAAPRRAARFSVVDWLLLGVASGAAFLAVEEVLRRLHWETASGFALLGRALASIGAGSDGMPEGWVRFGPDPFALGASHGGVATGSHVTFTALVAVSAGLGLAAWQHAARVGGPAARTLRALAVALPVGAFWIAAVDHFGWNANAGYRNDLVDGETPGWLDWRASTVPWVIRATWSFTGHGHGRVALLVLLAVAALLVDARRLARHPGHTPVPAVPPRWVASVPARAHTATRALPAPVTDAVVGLAHAAAALAWVVPRDVAAAVAAHGREGEEPRRSALARGRAYVAAQRAAREEALAADVVARAGTQAHLRVRRAGLVVLAALLATGLLVAPALAWSIGEVPYDAGAWLAAQLDGLGRWWNGLGLGQQILVGVGIAALVALSGGSLGLAFGISGVATYGLSKGQGAATFIRDPRAATREYAATATPAGVLIDAGEFLLTFAPGNFAGAAVGRGARQAGRELIEDPAAFWATRRGTLAGEDGAVSLEFLLGRHTPGDPATLGWTTSTNYRRTFFDAYPGLEGQVWVHHAVEQQVLRRYPTVATPQQIHSLENLRGIPTEVNSRLHLSTLRREWNRFYRQNPDPSLQDLLDHATALDRRYGTQFLPEVP